MKPIIFSTPMVQAILDGKKTQTRRVIKPQPSSGVRKSVFVKSGIEDGHGREIKPKYQPGDILWVRETWGNWSYDNPESNAVYFQYKADYPDGAKTYMYDDTHECDLPKWHPSIHMPREAARLFLRVKNVRVERLQEITPVEVVAEGMGAHECRECIDTYGNPCCQDEESECGLGDEILGDFRELWDSLNAKRGYGWDTNPWVWVIEFERAI